MSIVTTLLPKLSCRDLLKEPDVEVNNENAGWITLLNGPIWIYKSYSDKPRTVKDGENLLLIRAADAPYDWLGYGLMMMMIRDSVYRPMAKSLDSRH